MKKIKMPVGGDSFLRDLWKNYLTTKIHSDTKLNWLLGVSGLVASLILPYVFTSTESHIFYGLLLIAISGYLSFIISLLSLDLPEKMLGIPAIKSKNYMYPATFQNMSVKEIKDNLGSVKSYEDILEQYSVNMYNLINRNLMPKKKAFLIARDILVFGLIIGLLVIILGVAF